MKPPLRPMRNSPRKAILRRQPNSSNLHRAALSENLSLAEVQSNIRVAVRVRPTNERESNGNFRNVIKVASDKLLVFDPKEEDDDFFYHGVKQNNRDFTKKAHKDAHFAFDGVFPHTATNQEVFEGTTKAVVDAVLEGFNCSVFAYGATGAGKTHTMLGTTENPGIIFLTVMELYKKMEELRGTKKFEISVSYLEVYNENVRDLLAQSNYLSIRDNGNDGITVTGLSLIKPSGAEDLLSLLRYGNSNRTQHPTDHNAESSRSHAVFQVWIKQSDRASGLSTNMKMAKMSLIDLAGSERGCATGHSGERFREGNNINRSLLALGNCINALAEGRRHVPYRDSKLTRLLQDSLGGNCKTVMIAAVSPSSASYEDTYNTLKYADRAKNIKSIVKKNERSVQLHVTQYEKMISELRSALATANEKIQSLESEAAKTTPTPKSEETPAQASETETVCLRCSSAKEDASAATEEQLSSSFPSAELRKLRDGWNSLFHERREIQHKLVLLEQMEKEFQEKITLKKQKNERVGIICISTVRHEKLCQKLEREISLHKPKTEVVSLKKEKLAERLAANLKEEADLNKRLESIMPEIKDDDVKQIIRDAMRMKQLEVALQEAKDSATYLNRRIQAQSEESAQTETLLLNLLKAAKSFYLTLRVKDSAATYIEEDFNNLVTLVEGGRGVVWADQREKVRVEEAHHCSDVVTLSPLTEPDRFDVPPTSVLRQSYNPNSSEPIKFSKPNLDATVVLQTVDLDSTFDVQGGVDESSHPIAKQSQSLPVDAPSSPMPLSDLTTNIRYQTIAASPSSLVGSPANKENSTGMSRFASTSSIPVRTPSKEPKGGNSLTPKLRRGQMFSKSSTDLSAASQKILRPNQPGYMAATTASKYRVTTNDHQFLEPALPPPSGTLNRLAVSSFKKMKKSVSSISLSAQRR